MTSVFRSTGIMIPVFAAALFIAGCAKTPPPAEPVPPPPAAAEQKTEQKEESKPEVAKKIIVAKVNDVELSMDALVKMMNSLPEKIDGPETLDERKKRALDSLVLLELAYQRASAQGLNADPARIQIALENFREQFDGEKGLTDYLTRHGMTEADLLSEIERSLTINIIYTKEVAETTVVPEEELKKEYEKDKQQFIQPEKVSIIDVYLIKDGSKDVGKTAKKKAKELLKKIKADPAQDPWRLVLDGTFMVRSLTVRKDRDKELYDAAKKLKPQGLSGVIETPQSVHVIKLTEYSPERQLPFEEAKPKIEEKLKGPYVDKKTKEWEEGLKKGAKIELLLDAVEQQAEKKP